MAVPNCNEYVTTQGIHAQPHFMYREDMNAKCCISMMHMKYICFPSDVEVSGNICMEISILGITINEYIKLSACVNVQKMKKDDIQGY